MTTTTNYEGQSFKIDLYFSHQIVGYGHWHILCEVSYEGENKTFKRLTTDSEFIDKINDLKADGATWDEIQKIYYDKSFEYFKENIIEWCEEVEENEY
jgi:hypothetical protein